MVRRFILGADGPEMKAIAGYLVTHKQEVWWAAVDGERCHSGNAYMANGIVRAGGALQTRRLGDDYTDLIFVECRPADVPLEQKHSRLKVIDHHEEGDPGYDLGPDRFWEASSLGQVVALLDSLGYQPVVTQSMRVLAAMDHCRQAAIRGECSGVTAAEVVALRVASIAERHHVPATVVRGLITNFGLVFQARRPVAFGGGSVIDFTHYHLGVGYSAQWLCAQTALDMHGLIALLRNTESPSSRDEKIMLSGHATPEMVQYFLDIYAPQKHLSRVFGVPKRGYAGGYLYP